MSEVELSARNQLEGTVKAVSHGMVNSEITIEIQGGAEVVSVITKSSAERLGLTEGKSVRAVIKATSVMVATD